MADKRLACGEQRLLSAPAVHGGAGLVACLYMLCSPAWCDETITAADTAPALYVLPANSEIRLRMVESVASNTHERGDRFRLEAAEVVAIDGCIVIPAGSPGEGEVVHAAKPGMAGRAGELILVARFVRTGDLQVKLRSFTAGTGENRLNLAAGLAPLGIPALFVVGKNIVVPAGAEVFAKVAADASLPSFLGMETAPTAPPSMEIDIQTEINNDEQSQQ